MERKEAIEIVRKLYNESLFLKKDMEAMVTLIPELAESEEGKIKKIIKQSLKSFFEGKLSSGTNDVDYAMCLTWLEKQGEKHLENYDEAEKEKADFVGDGFIECHANFLDFKEGNTYWLEYIGDDKYNVRSDNLLGKTYHITPCQLYTIFKKQTWLEKQGEQKPIVVDNIEPKFKVGDTMRTLEEANSGITDGMPVVVSIDDKYYRCNNELIAIKDQDDYEYPPINKKHNAWSEEDAKTLNRISAILVDASEVKNWWKESRLIEREEMVRLTDFLKSLKDRVQPKQKWSEEDEDNLTDIFVAIDNFHTTNHKKELITFLKSLKAKVQPQSTWKPSDEQIKVCKKVYADILSAKGFDLGTINGELNRLEEELKKLREK